MLRARFLQGPWFHCADPAPRRPRARWNIPARRAAARSCLLPCPLVDHHADVIVSLNNSCEAAAWPPGQVRSGYGSGNPPAARRRARPDPAVRTAGTTCAPDAERVRRASMRPAGTARRPCCLIKRSTADTASLVCRRRQHHGARRGRLARRFARFPGTRDFADRDDVRVLTQDRPQQSRAESQCRSRR